MVSPGCKPWAGRAKTCRPSGAENPDGVNGVSPGSKPWGMGAIALASADSGSAPVSAAPVSAAPVPPAKSARGYATRLAADGSLTPDS